MNLVYLWLSRFLFVSWAAFLRRLGVEFALSFSFSGRIRSLFVACLLGIALSGCQSGNEMPSFSMTDLSGRTITNESLKGQVVLIDFWAEYCGPCRMASPVMQQLHEKYSNEGLVVIGANTSDTVQDVFVYSREHKLTYTFTTGNYSLLSALGTDGIPTFVVLDTRGRLRYFASGFEPMRTSAALENIIEQCLAEKVQ